MFAYFLTTFVISWALWYLASITSAGGARWIFLLLGTFTPGFVAIGFTARRSGSSGVQALLRRLLDWQVPVRWYVFAISYIAAIKLTVALLLRVSTGVWPRFGEDPWYLMFVAAIFSTLTGGQTGEEIGWRGYALPRLASHFGAGKGSLLLGAIWAIWHLPFFFVIESDTFGQSFPLYFLQVTALSVAFAWLFANTRGSLLPVMLLHAAVNNTKDIVPSAERGATNSWALSHSPVGWLTVALLWLVAGYFLFQLRKAPKLTRFWDNQV